MATQMGVHQDMLDVLSEEAARCAHARLDDKLQSMDQFDNEFRDEHRALIRDYSSLLVDHPYMRDEVDKLADRQVCRDCAAYRERVFRLKDQLVPEGRMEAASSAANSECSSLPGISLPEFKGDYAEWLALAGLFTNLVREREGLTDVKRFHYLKGCLKDAAPHLVASLPVLGE